MNKLKYPLKRALGKFENVSQKLMYLTLMSVVVCWVTTKELIEFVKIQKRRWYE